MRSLEVSSNDDWQQIVAPVLDLADRIQEVSVIAGRGAALRGFIDHVNTDPTPGLSQAWFENQTAELRHTAQEADRQTKAFLERFDEQVQVSPEWLATIEALAELQGWVHGTAEELESLHGQAVAYHRDLQAAMAQDQQVIAQQQQSLAALQSAIAYQNQLNYQQQLLNNLNRPRTCQVVGSTIQCY